MPLATKYRFKCEVCGKEFEDKNISVAEARARDCEKSHEFIYLKIQKSDFLRLVEYVYTGERKVLTESLMDVLRRYQKLNT